jgi:hypothetical protein
LSPSRRGTLLYSLRPGKRGVMGQRVTVHGNFKANCAAHMDELVAKL